MGGRAGGHKCRKLFHEVGCEGELKEEGQWLEAGLRPRENSLLVKIYLVMFICDGKVSIERKWMNGLTM